MRVQLTASVIVAFTVLSCSSATSAISPNGKTLATPSTGVVQVYIETRAVGSETSQRTRVGGAKDFPIPGSSWHCVYRKPIDAHPVPGHPLSGRYDVRIHIVECTAAGVGAGISLTCPVLPADLIATLDGARTRAAVLALSEQTTVGERRNVVSIICEP
jgi:hypothetical protein